MHPQLQAYVDKAQIIRDRLDSKVAEIQAAQKEFEAAFSKQEMELIMRVIRGEERMPTEDTETEAV